MAELLYLTGCGAVNLNSECLQLHSYLIEEAQKGKIIFFIRRLGSVRCQICFFLNLSHPTLKKHKQGVLIICGCTIPSEVSYTPSSLAVIAVFKR